MDRVTSPLFTLSNLIIQNKLSNFRPPTACFPNTIVKFSFYFIFFIEVSIKSTASRSPSNSDVFFKSNKFKLSVNLLIYHKGNADIIRNPLFKVLCSLIHSSTLTALSVKERYGIRYPSYSVGHLIIFDCGFTIKWQADFCQRNNRGKSSNPTLNCETRKKRNIPYFRSDSCPSPVSWLVVSFPDRISKPGLLVSG